MSLCSNISWRKATSIDLSKMSFFRLKSFGPKLLRLYVATMGKFSAAEILSLLFVFFEEKGVFDSLDIDTFPSSWSISLKDMDRLFFGDLSRSRSPLFGFPN